MCYKKEVLENKIECFLSKRAKDLGALYWKFTSPGNSGVPDRLFIYQGCTYYIELKKPGGRLRPLQEKRKKDLLKVGIVVHVLSTKEGVESFVKIISAAHC